MPPVSGQSSVSLHALYTHYIPGAEGSRLTDQPPFHPNDPYTLRIRGSGTPDQQRNSKNRIHAAIPRFMHTIAPTNPFAPSG